MQRTANARKNAGNSTTRDDIRAVSVDVFSGEGGGIWTDFVYHCVASTSGKGWSMQRFREAMQTYMEERAVLEFHYWPQMYTTVKFARDTSEKKYFKVTIVEDLYTEEVVLRRSIKALNRRANDLRDQIDSAGDGEDLSTIRETLEFIEETRDQQSKVLGKVQQERGAYEESRPGYVPPEGGAVRATPEERPLKSDREIAKERGIDLDALMEGDVQEWQRAMEIME